MKAIVAIKLIMAIGALALAQNLVNHESQIKNCKVGALLDHCVIRAFCCEEYSQNIRVARLYKRPNARVRKALNFKTKYTKAKLA